MTAAHMEAVERPERRRRDAPAPAAPARGLSAGPDVTTAVLLATAPAAEGGAAAGLAWDEGTVLARLLGQLARLGVRTAHVVARPADGPSLTAGVGAEGCAVHVHASPDVAADARLIATAARRASGGVVVAHGDIAAHDEALGGLLADPRIATGILAGAPGRPLTFGVRAARGRVLDAGSPHHAVRGANLGFLGVVKVAAGDREALAGAADRLADLLAGGPPPGWEEELARQAARWRAGRGTADGEDAPDLPLLPPDASAAGGSPGVAAQGPLDEQEVARRVAVAREDVVALLVVALVRAGVPVATGDLRNLGWTRALSASAVDEAAGALARVDVDRALLDASVKSTDGFFATYFVSPYSKHLARWAARRGWSPNAVTIASLAVGLLAAAAFATGGRAGLVAGAVLLQAAFALDCVDGQLARYTQRFSQLGAWLDSVFDRTKEYAVYAGLAIGAGAQGDPVWLLAGCALALQTTRHVFDFTYAAAQLDAIRATAQPPLEQPSAAGPRRPAAPRAGAGLPSRGLGLVRGAERRSGLRWAKRVVAFPIGERFAVISLTAALATPRATFLVVLAWAALATAYTLTGRLLRSAAR